MSRKIVTLLILIFHFSVYGQKARKIDSLKTELARASADTLKVKLLFSISMNYQGLQPDSAMTYALESLEKSVAMGYIKGQADAVLHIGRLKRDLGRSDEALQDMLTALKLYREIADQVQIANSLNDISIIYAQSEDYEKSLDYFQQALEIFRQMGDEKGESYALNNIGLIYQALDDETMAKDYFIQSLRIKEKNQDLYGISRGYINLGSIAERNDQWNEALTYYLRADSILEKTNDSQAQAANYVAIARVKDHQHKPGEAMRYALLGLEKAQEVKALPIMLNASRLLSDWEERRSNYKVSLEYQKLYNQIADSLRHENHQKNLEELKAKFNVDEKEREIELLKIDKELHQAIMERNQLITYSLSVGMLFLLLISGLVYYAYRTTKKNKDSLAVKNKEIEQQRNDLDILNKEKDRFFSILSHDLRAPLSSLKGLSHLITNHTDVLTQKELTEIHTKINTSLDNLTELINNVLEWSVSSMQNRKWNFERINTTELIQKNISLYKTIAESKGVRLKYTPKVELYGYADYHAVDTVIRNLLSNSIKFSHADKEVDVNIMKSESNILISVKDEGIGIPFDLQDKLFTLNTKATQSGTNNEKGAGIGLTLCKQLMTENNGDILVKSEPGKGSEFIVSLPEYFH